MKKRKSEDQLTRFVWSRKVEYDYSLLLEVQLRNPYSFRKPKQVWEEIARALRACELKMKVTDRSCRERVGELLKKHRKEEGVIMRSTGAADDKITELKKLLIAVNEMALTKPNETHSSIHIQENRKEGEIIRDAVLSELSDSDSDDYIHENSSRNDASKKSRHNEELEPITFSNHLYNDEMSLTEESLMDRQLQRESLESNHDQTDESQSWKDVPSSSRDNRYSILEASIQTDDTSTASMEKDKPVSVDDDVGDLADRRLVRENKTTSVTTLGSSVSMHKDKTSTSYNKQFSNPEKEASNNRFSNPKKDLIKFLEIKSENEMCVRREEIRIWEMEVQNKKEELQILRLKTEIEAEKISFSSPKRIS